MKPWKDPFIFAPFGFGPRNTMCRADGSYRRLTRMERAMWLLFKRMPRDKYTKGIFERGMK